MEKSLKIRAKITKQKDLTNHKMPTIIEGKQFNGYFFEWPKVGSSFLFFDMDYWHSVPISTTQVLEIIDEKTFKTRNSIYTIYTVEQQRDDKINNILN
jgi:hypothetical protein